MEKRSEERRRADAFKVGFLRGIADSGMLPSDVAGLAKHAEFGETVLSTLGDVAGHAGNAALTGGKYLGAAGLIAPLAIGGAAGVGKALLEAPTEDDMDTIRKAEMLATLRRQTHEIFARRQGK